MARKVEIQIVADDSNYIETMARIQNMDEAQRRKSLAGIRASIEAEARLRKQQERNLNALQREEYKLQKAVERRMESVRKAAAKRRKDEENASAKLRAEAERQMKQANSLESKARAENDKRNEAARKALATKAKEFASAEAKMRAEAKKSLDAQLRGEAKLRKEAERVMNAQLQGEARVRAEAERRMQAQLRGSARLRKEAERRAQLEMRAAAAAANAAKLQVSARASGTFMSGIGTFKGNTAQVVALRQRLHELLQTSGLTKRAMEGLWERAGNGATYTDKKIARIVQTMQRLKTAGKMSYMRKSLEESNKLLAKINERMLRFTHLLGVQLFHQAISAIVRSLHEGVQEALKLRQAVAEIRTISQGKGSLSSKAWVEGLRNQSDLWGQSMSDQAASTYQILSNRIAGASGALRVLNTANELAAATVSRTEEAVNALSTSLNAFSKGTIYARTYASHYFELIKLGRVRLSELHNEMGDVSVMMAQLGGQEAELAGMISQLTIRGMKAPVAITQIRGILTKLINPTKEMIGLFDKLGMSSGRAAVEAYGVAGLIDQIKQLTKGKDELRELFKFFNRIRGVSGAITFASDIGGLAKANAQIANSLEEYNNAVQIAMENEGKKVQILRERIKNFFAVDMAQKVFDLFGLGSTDVDALSKRLNGLATDFKFIAATVAQWLGTLFLVNKALLPIIAKIKSLHIVRAWPKLYGAAMAQIQGTALATSATIGQRWTAGWRATLGTMRLGFGNAMKWMKANVGTVLMAGVMVYQAISAYAQRQYERTINSNAAVLQERIKQNIGEIQRISEATAAVSTDMAQMVHLAFQPFLQQLGQQVSKAQSGFKELAEQKIDSKPMLEKWTREIKDSESAVSRLTTSFRGLQSILEQLTGRRERVAREERYQKIMNKVEMFPVSDTKNRMEPLVKEREMLIGTLAKADPSKISGIIDEVLRYQDEIAKVGVEHAKEWNKQKDVQQLNIPATEREYAIKRAQLEQRLLKYAETRVKNEVDAQKRALAHQKEWLNSQKEAAEVMKERVKEIALIGKEAAAAKPGQARVTAVQKYLDRVTTYQEAVSKQKGTGPIEAAYFNALQMRAKQMLQVSKTQHEAMKKQEQAAKLRGDITKRLEEITQKEYELSQKRVEIQGAVSTQLGKMKDTLKSFVDDLDRGVVQEMRDRAAKERGPWAFAPDDRVGVWLGAAFTRSMEDRLKEMHTALRATGISERVAFGTDARSAAYSAYKLANDTDLMKRINPTTTAGALKIVRLRQGMIAGEMLSGTNTNMGDLQGLAALAKVLLEKGVQGVSDKDRAALERNKQVAKNMQKTLEAQGIIIKPLDRNTEALHHLSRDLGLMPARLKEALQPVIANIAARNRALGSYRGGPVGYHRGGAVGYHRGGSVSSVGMDTVNANLARGEYVMSRQAVQAFRPAIAAMNDLANRGSFNVGDIYINQQPGSPALTGEAVVAALRDATRKGLV